MKKMITLAILCLSFKSWSQDNLRQKPAMIEQYCQVTTSQTGGLFSLKVNIDVDYGQEVKKQKDMRIKDSADSYKTFNTVVDALNYMGKQGWLLVNVYITALHGSTDNAVYIFKKLFPASEVK